MAGARPCGASVAILLAVHITAGLTCVITGAVAALSPKRPGRHPWFGTTYYWSPAVVFATVTVLAAMRWPEDAYLLVLGTCSFAAASAGRLARRRRRTWHLPGGWAVSHINGMSASYIVLLTAFYAATGTRQHNSSSSYRRSIRPGSRSCGSWLQGEPSVTCLAGSAEPTCRRHSCGWRAA